jgi:predicted Zn-dependent protease
VTPSPRSSGSDERDETGRSWRAGIREVGLMKNVVLILAVCAIGIGLYFGFIHEGPGRGRVSEGEGARLPPIAKLRVDGHALVLIPMGEVDTRLLEGLRRSLQGALDIRVFIQDAGIALPPYKRDRLTRMARSFRERLSTLRDSPQVKKVLAESAVDEEKLQDDRVVLALLRKLTEMSADADAVKRLDSAIQEARGAEAQWDMDELLKELRNRVRAYKSPNIGYMGVASVDAFWRDNNFIFGVGNPSGHGVITYYRFTSEFNGETPNEQKLLSRTFKQALSTAGFIFGVPRCSDPKCVRAYPNSLAEHDAKSSEFCDACREGFHKVFGRKGR